MFDPRRIKIFQGVKRKVRENTTPHLRYVNSRGTAVPQPLLVTVVFIVKGNPLLFSVANYKLYVNSDRSNRTTSTLCCWDCQNCNRRIFRLTGFFQFLRYFLLLLFLHICLVIVLSVAWMGVLLCGPRVPRGRICISLYSNQGYQGGEGDGGSFIRVGEVITMK